MAKRLYELIIIIKQKCQANETEIQRKLGLTQAEFNAFLILKEEEQIGGCELAERMTLSPSRSSRVLNKLVRNKYIDSIQNTLDRRSLLLSLTEKGAETKKEIEKCLINCETRIFSSLSKTEADEVSRALNLLVKTL